MHAKRLILKSPASHYNRGMLVAEQTARYTKALFSWPVVVTPLYLAGNRYRLQVRRKALLLMDAVSDCITVDNPFISDPTEHVLTPAQRHARRLERAAYCFANFRHRSRNDGAYYMFAKPCGEYRVCERCRKYRAKQFKERAERCEWMAMSKSGCTRRAYVIYASPVQARSIIRKQGKEWVFAIPRATDVFMIVASESEMGEQLDSAMIDSIDWTTLCITPEGKKVSGMLGKKPTAKPESDGVVTIQCFVPSGITLEAEAHAEEMAVRETSYLNPKTLAELQEALNIRQRALIAQVTKHGGKIVAYTQKREHVKLSDIDWTKYNSKKSDKAVRRAHSNITHRIHHHGYSSQSRHD